MASAVAPGRTARRRGDRGRALIIRTFVPVGLLVTIYVVVLGSAEAGDLAVGGMTAVILLIIYRRRLWEEGPRPEGGALRRSVAFVPFVWAVALQVIKGTLDTASVVLGLKKTSPGMLMIPIGDRSAVGCAVTSLVVTLSPGTLLIDFDVEEGYMLFHVIDAADPDAFRATQQHLYEKYQKKVFP